jgi:uncharacterized membrane protein YvbJ
MPYCENCGAEVNPNTSFCKKCGAAVNVASMMPPPPPVESNARKMPLEKRFEI